MTDADLIREARKFVSMHPAALILITRLAAALERAQSGEQLSLRNTAEWKKATLAAEAQRDHLLRVFSTHVDPETMRTMHKELAALTAEGQRGENNG